MQLQDNIVFRRQYESKLKLFAAGQGFEPRYQLPKSCVLPLDDPASVTPEGLEPSTITLKGCCSTIELRGRVATRRATFRPSASSGLLALIGCSFQNFFQKFWVNILPKLQSNFERSGRQKAEALRSSKGISTCRFRDEVTPPGVEPGLSG